MEAYIWLLLHLHSPLYDIDPLLAGAVIHVESSFNPSAIGALKEVGLFQIRPEYSEYTAEELLDPETNVKEGLRMLGEAKKRCLHKDNKQFVICHNTGIAGAKKIDNPSEFIYYKKVYKQYVSLRGRNEY